VELLKKHLYSLGTKFVLLVIIILTATFAITGIVNYHSQSQALIGNLIKKGKEHGNFLAAISPYSILSHDYTSLDTYVRKISQTDEIVYAMVFSSNGHNMTSFLDSENSYIKPLLKEDKNIDMHALIERINKNRDIIPLVFPIFFNDERLGFITLGLSRNNVDKLTRSGLIRTLIGNTLIIIVLSVFIFVILRYSALMPITNLIRGSESVGRGDLTSHVQIKSNDELGVLTAAFNNMVNSLKISNEQKDDALRQLHELNRTLESRVDNRTHELKSLNLELRHMALHDTLTNLPNRTLLQDRLEQAIRTAHREKKEIGYILMDLDRFKEINDTLGHDVGDLLLIDVGKRLQDELRETDTAGRLGGDEFGIVLPSTGYDEAILVAKKLHRALEEPFQLYDMNFAIGASLGIAIYPQHGEDALTLIRRADVAMYRAKHNNLGLSIYDPDHDTLNPNRLALMSELRQSLEDSSLLVHYQPVINLENHQIARVEALIRWRHPQRGLLSPDQFIPFAEHTEVIKPLTQWVLNSVIEQWHSWRKHGITTIVAVNLSMRNLHDPDLIECLDQLINLKGMKSNSLVLEITESALMYDPIYVQGILQEISRMGIHISIDDFGTGYSSINHLRRLAVNEVKIDRSFVIDMAKDKDDAVIVRSIIDMAHNLGLQVVAEGVETKDVLDILEDHECDMAQGYYLGRPMPTEQVTAILGKQSPPSGKSGEILS
jgi:diguanylate cyclase (GGDEF)-like protein